MRSSRPRRRLLTMAAGVTAAAVAALTLAPAASAAAPFAGAAATAAPAAKAAVGSFPLTFVNKAAATYPNSKVYVTMLGMTAPGQWSYVKPDGTTSPINHRDAQASNHLTKKGIAYPNMSFTLAQAATMNVPPKLEGGRVYISLGSPMYIGVSPDDKGWAGPDLHNPTDPNADVLFDWYEFTYEYGRIAFGGNTTQVDMLGFPMTARLQQTSSGYDQTVGIAATRADVFAKYKKSVSPAFAGLENPYRIVAPRTGAPFAPGGAQHTYLDAYIDQTWKQYTDHTFSLTRLGQTFTGRVENNRLVFTKDGVGPFMLDKPTTNDVLACSGALANPTLKTVESELGAEFCAAFNRGVATNTAHWYQPSTYYQTAPSNEYSRFMHQENLGHRAYGFAYDDVNDQSSVRILNNTNPPTHLTITIEPMS